MPLVVNVTDGGSQLSKPGVRELVREVAKRAAATRIDRVDGEPMLDVYIYVSGTNWQHEREGIRLGSLSARGRDWLRVMIYVPDDVTTVEAAEAYLQQALPQAAALVRKRLVSKRPDWPIDRLEADLLSLSP